MTDNGIRKKILPLLFVIAAVIAVAVLGYIGITGGSSQDIEQQQSQTKISVSWWGNDDRHLYMLKGLDLFQKANPDIEVAHHYGVWNGYETRTKVSMKANTESDVMQINYAWLNTYSKDGTGYYDLNKLNNIIDLSGYSKDDLAYGTVNGRLNALPIAYNSIAFFYNKDTLDKYGLQVPATWDDLFNAAAVMKKDGVYPISMAKKMMWLLIVAEYEQETGRTLFNPDGTLAAQKDDIEIMLNFYKRLISEKVFQPVDSFNISDMNTGVTCGVMCWNNDAGRYCDKLAERGTNVVMGPELTMGGAKRSGWYMKPATMYAISNITDNPAEAARLLNFLINDPDMAKLQGSEKGIPVNKNVRDIVLGDDSMDKFEAEANQMMLKNRDSLNTFTPELENEDIIDIFKSQSDRYLYNNAGLDTCAYEIIQGIDSL
jgi:oligogalacturonide transport system substrate-binding protein